VSPSRVLFQFNINLIFVVDLFVSGVLFDFYQLYRARAFRFYSVLSGT
jgi:hypothetical protein